VTCRWGLVEGKVGRVRRRWEAEKEEE